MEGTLGQGWSWLAKSLSIVPYLVHVNGLIGAKLI